MSQHQQPFFVCAKQTAQPRAGVSKPAAPLLGRFAAGLQQAHSLGTYLSVKISSLPINSKPPLLGFRSRLMRSSANATNNNWLARRMSGMPEIQLCVGHRLDGKVLEEMPVDPDDLARVEPVFEA